MPETTQFQPARALYLFGTVVAGAACTKWIPSNWFLNVLGCSILVALILAFLATLDLKNERRPSIPVTLLLEVLWLPSRNAEIKFGPILWAFMAAAGFSAGILVSAIILPFLV
jgi:hypothetical protein